MTAPECANLRPDAGCARVIAIRQVEWRVTGGSVVVIHVVYKAGQSESLNPSYHHIGLLFSATFLQFAWLSLSTRPLAWGCMLSPDMLLVNAELVGNRS